MGTILGTFHEMTGDTWIAEIHLRHEETDIRWMLSGRGRV